MGLKRETRTVVETREVEETTTREEAVEREEEVIIPVCDFCEQEFPDEGEGYLTPVALNPRVESPGGVHETVTIPMDSSFRAGMELQHAFSKTNLFGFKRKRVMDVEGEVAMSDGAYGALPSVKTSISDKEIAYQFTAPVPDTTLETDGEIEICEFCESLFD